MPVERSEVEELVGAQVTTAFAHYPTAVRPEGTWVRRSRLSILMHKNGRDYPVYPELRSLFDQTEVQTALDLAKRPISLSSLEQELATAVFHEEPWRVTHLTAWLLKHGLLLNVDPLPEAPTPR